MTDSTRCRAQALYAFYSDQPSYLKFQEDEYIEVLAKSDSGWWLGCTQNQTAPGWFPKDYVVIVPEPAEQDSGSDMEDQVPQELPLKVSLPLPTDPQDIAGSDAELMKRSCSLWTVQETEDGLDCYLFNPVTGEMRSAEREEDFEDDDSEKIDEIENNSNRRSWIGEETDFGSVDHEERGEQEEDEEEATFIPEKIPSRWASYVLPHHDSPLIQENVYDDLLESPTDEVKEDQPPTNDPPKWEDLCGCVAVTVYNLNLAVKFSMHHLYLPYTIALINAVRLLLMATIDPLDLDRNEAIRTHHRIIISNLSKLILSVKGDSPHSISGAEEIQYAVRDFVSTCQCIPIVPRPVDHLIWPDDNSIPNANANANASTTNGPAAEDDECMDMRADQSREYRQSSTGSSVTYLTSNTYVTASTMATAVSDRYSTAIDYEFCMTACAQGLLEILDSMISQVANKGPKSLPPADLVTILLQRLDHVSRAASKLFAAAERAAHDITLSKQRIIQELGLLLCQLQTLGDGKSPTFEADLQKVGDMMKSINQSVQAIIHRAKEQGITPLPPPANEPKLWITPKQCDDTTVVQSPTTLSPNDDKRWYMRHDHGPDDICFAADGQVKGGTLEALVERLTYHDQIDMTFNSTFLLTYRSFCTSIELLHLLEARFNKQPPKGLLPEELAEWREKKQKLIRLRVFNVFKLWMEQYFNEKEDNMILDELQRFTDGCIRGAISVDSLERLISKRQRSEPDIKRRTISSLPPQPQPLLPRNMKKFQLLDVNPLELARQLTMIDFQIFGAIQPEECLSKTGAVRSSIEYSNKVTLWVSDSIVTQKDFRKRTSLIKYWIQVAEKCHSLQNFNTCMAVLSALDNSAIGRLKRTWEAVGTRPQTTLAHLRKVLGASRNFVAYRSLIHSVNPPCIPFVGVYLQDLTFIEDGNADFLKNRRWINFSKRAKIGDVIREIQQYQSTPYNFSQVPALQTFIETNLQAAHDEEYIYHESLKIEPREGAKEAMARLVLESGIF